MELGVNIDHVATIRQARQTNEPDPVTAAALAQLGGADGITVHLREDRRHIQDRDLRILRQTVTCKLNMELACNEEVLAIACQVKPDQATVVPERRQEVTTEGGLDVAGNFQKFSDSVKRLHDAGIVVSLFLDPVEAQIEAAVKCNADAVEIHTGRYANTTGNIQLQELEIIKRIGKQIVDSGMRLHAGHGLTYHNVLPIAEVDNMLELNIGHSIISRAVYVGLVQAVKDMKSLLNQSQLCKGRC